MQTRLLKNSARFSLGVLRKKPFQCLIQVTNRCNMRCDFCDFWPNGAPPKKELSLAEYESVAAQLAKINSFIISIEGGEPFVRPDIIDIVRIFGREHLPLLYTNGWYINEDNARALFEAGVTQVGVSIDFPDAARHDAKRGLPGAFEQAWRAVEMLRAAAPNGKRQVHVMTVYMRDNQDDLEALLKLSRDAGVGHCLTLISLDGYRRNRAENLPPTPEAARGLPALWKKYKHLRVFQDYAELVEPFVKGDGLPTCAAGLQSFNIDHLGNVSPCIEKINHIAGNVREESLAAIHARLTAPENLQKIAACNDCWSLCRGFTQSLGGGSDFRNMRDLSTRMKSF